MYFLSSISDMKYVTSQDDDDDNGKGKDIFQKTSPFCLQNFVWLATAGLVFYFSDFISVIAYDSHIKGYVFLI